MPLYDKQGNKRSYDELLTAAPRGASAKVTPETLSTAYDRTFAAIAELNRQIQAAKVDALIIIGDDQHELFQDAMMPSLAIYYGTTIRNAARRGPAPADWYQRAQLQRLEPEKDAYYPVDAAVALHLIEQLTASGFDICAIRELRPDQYEGHAFSYIHRNYLAERAVPVVPVLINTYYAPNPIAPKRCIELGQALAEAIKSLPKPLGIGLLASGGLSHFVVDEELDLAVLEAIRVHDLDYLAALDPKRLQAGSSEIRSWICVAGACASAGLQLQWMDYIPAYRTPALTGIGLGFARWGKADA
jgi:3-O-methylgallate 3,4-dioxygenase